MRQRGIDAVEAEHGLVGVDLALTRLQSNDWEKLKPQDLPERLRSEPVPRPQQSASFHQMPGTYAVRTREGSLGLLQIMETSRGKGETPSSGVKIRYRLVKTTLPPK